MAEDKPPEASQPRSHATSLLRSVSEGVRTIVTVTERLNDLRVETKELHLLVRQLANDLSRLNGRLDGIEQRFVEVDKRIELSVKVAVREEVERLDRDRRG